jgi:parallel beta-helix repeat protein
VPDDYETIQDAVDNADSGDTIIVRDGICFENVKVDKEHLTIRSENGPDSTIVLAPIINDPVFEVSEDYVNISGFTVKGATYSNGIYLLGACYCDISNNNASNNYDGIYLYASRHNNITNNRVSDNNHDGIDLRSSSNNNTITNNIASNNNNYGIYSLRQK